MRNIDLRSDTVTQPTPEMREAMARAEVGDDVYGEDPTVNHLQQTAAARLGKEAGLFVPSGTMGNLIAILCHCGRGEEAIVGNLSHTFLFEAGGLSALGGVHSCQVPNRVDGTLRLQDVRAAIRPDDIHQPVTRLICIENTQNYCGGVALTPEYTAQIADLAHENQLLLHLDGARIFNAAVALGVDVQELTRPVDSVNICLSKGLCAPVGSVLCGSHRFIEQARRIRKQLGGGMRQAGVLAAAGQIALDQMPARLGEDHLRARQIAEQMADIPALVLDDGTPYTNMIFADLRDDYPLEAPQVVNRLAQEGLLIGTVGPRRFRLVTHYWIDEAAVEECGRIFKKVLDN